jgi:hypothetical protein
MLVKPFKMTFVYYLKICMALEKIYVLGRFRDISSFVKNPMKLHNLTVIR